MLLVNGDSTTNYTEIPDGGEHEFYSTELVNYSQSGRCVIG